MQTTLDVEKHQLNVNIWMLDDFVNQENVPTVKLWRSREKNIKKTNWQGDTLTLDKAQFQSSQKQYQYYVWLGKLLMNTIKVKQNSINTK